MIDQTSTLTVVDDAGFWVGSTILINGEGPFEVLAVHGNTLTIDLHHPWWWRIIEAVLLWLE